MRQVLSFVVVVLLSTGTGFAQEEWRTFTSQKDRFSVLIPTQEDPVVTDIIWETEYGGKLPARVYTAKKGPSAYIVTVVDYNPLKEQQIAKSKNCVPGVGECTADSAGRRSEPNGIGYWKTDTRGAMIYTAFKYLKEDVRVNYYMWNWLGQGPESNELQLTSRVDGSRIFVSTYMYHNWLYVLESRFPSTIPPPLIFQQSVGLKEADGKGVSHGKTYFNAAELDPNEVFPFGRNAGAGPAGTTPAPAGRGNAAPAPAPAR